jgi:anaerobic magnesium-protoporphyrin IX monomethyl ester cyclase
MRIVLFYPRGSTYSAERRNVNHLACIMPPVGLASIAAVLRSAGHEVRIIDAALFCTVTNDRWAEKIVEWKADMVGFSAITSAFCDAYDVCLKIKQRNSYIKTVFGGVHASWGKKSLLEKFDAVDFIIAGEGEYSLNKLVSGTSPDLIEGLYYRNGNRILAGHEEPMLCDMDSLPFPAYDLLEGFPHSYLMPLFSYPSHPGAGIISSRGCVHRCTYCDRSVFGRTFRWNSPEYTVSQMEWLRRDFGVRHINFYDDQFAANRDRVEDLCTMLISRKNRMSFNCIVRLGHIDTELCRLLKTAKCWMVNVGIESGDQAVLDMHKDGLTLEMIRTDVNILMKNGIYVKGLFMMGLPGETPETIIKTRDFALSLPLKDANITAFTPFPGARITDNISMYGKFEGDWSKMDCEHFVFVPDTVPSRKFLEEQYALFIKSFYQRPFMRKIYRQMLFRSPHSYLRLLRNIGAFFGYFLRINRKKQRSNCATAP